jgi:hypothetical protein
MLEVEKSTNTKKKIKFSQKLHPKGFCFLQFLLCRQTGDHPQEDLVKFGYRSDAKVHNFKNLFIFWLPGEFCCRNLAIKKRIPTKSGKLGSFFHQNPLHVLK